MLRFFTVYGPWGRPDMALFKFVSGILNNKPIDIYSNGKMYRDFTYIDDLINGIRMLIDTIPSASRKIHITDSLSPVAPYRIVNIGNSKKIKLINFIEAIEDNLGIKAIRNFLPMQKGDVPATWADISLLSSLTNYSSQTNFKDGIDQFIKWYRKYYNE
jgi:UDP-glucuronate 4-epimerase